MRLSLHLYSVIHALRAREIIGWKNTEGNYTISVLNAVKYSLTEGNLQDEG